MSKHTPGPWTLRAEKCAIGCCDDIQRVIAKYPEDDEPGRMLATVDGGNAVWLRDGETEANARLIAAAPDLLTACKAVVAECSAVFIDTDEMSADWRSLEAQLLSAIEKAEGAA